MDKTQYAAVQNAAKAVAGEAMAMGLAGSIRDAVAPLPEEARSQFLLAMRATLEAARAEYQRVTIPGYTAEMSDLMAGEFQEAFAKLSEKVMRKMEGKK